MSSAHPRGRAAEFPAAPVAGRFCPWRYAFPRSGPCPARRSRRHATRAWQRSAVMVRPAAALALMESVARAQLLSLCCKCGVIAICEKAEQRRAGRMFVPVDWRLSGSPQVLRCEKLPAPFPQRRSTGAFLQMPKRCVAGQATADRRCHSAAGQRLGRAPNAAYGPLCHQRRTQALSAPAFAATGPRWRRYPSLALKPIRK